MSDEPQRPKDVPDDAILRIIRVPPESHGMRLDRFLTTQLRATSRTRASLIIDNSAYSWTGRRMKASDRVKGEDRIALWRPALDETPPPTEITTIYEDAQLLVVNKPALMTVHPTARHHRHTVIRSLQSSRPDQYLSLLHRLDRETSGILMLAKSAEADRRIKMQLERRAKAEARAAQRNDPVPPACDKAYLAITWGRPMEGLISEPLEPDPSPLRVKMKVAPQGSGLPSRTGFSVLETKGNYALVRCELYTGRQHQIRVHLSHLGTPIVGDKLYGPDEQYLARGADNELTEEDLAVLELPRHALHSTYYRMIHPYTDQVLEFEAPLPEDLARFWADLDAPR